MSRILTFAILIILSLSNCERDEINSYLDSFKKNYYYSNEIIPEEYQKIYGKWKLIGISGGFSGTGYKPDFDFMEIKSIGIYGLIKNDSVFEYGRVELDTFDNATSKYLQITLIPDYYRELNSYMHPPEKYINIRGDSLDLNSPCCDMFNYHFKRIKYWHEQTTAHNTCPGFSGTHPPAIFELSTVDRLLAVGYVTGAKKVCHRCNQF